MWDAVGVVATTGKMKAAGRTLAPAVQKLLEKRQHYLCIAGYLRSFRPPLFSDIATATYKPVPAVEGMASVQILKKAHGVVKRRPQRFPD